MSKYPRYAEISKDAQTEEHHSRALKKAGFEEGYLKGTGGDTDGRGTGNMLIME